MQTFRTADGRTLAYRSEGAGPLLVCHPGGPGFSGHEFGDLAGLADTHTLFVTPIAHAFVELDDQTALRVVGPQEGAATQLVGDRKPPSACPANRKVGRPRAGVES